MIQVPNNSDYENQNFDGEKFINHHFVGCRFYKCSFKNAEFKNCTVDNTLVTFNTFLNCDFESAIFKGCQFQHSDFSNSSFKGATIRGSNFEGADFKGCNLDDSSINNSIFKNVEFSNSTIRSARITDIHFLPTKRTSSSSILKLLFTNDVETRLISTSGTELSHFTEYCNREYRISQFISLLKSMPFPKKHVSIIFIYIIGLISDFGNSLLRWFFATFVINIASALVLSYNTNQFSFNNILDNFTVSLMYFFNFSTSNQLPVYHGLTLVFSGYFMLGLLIAIISNRYMNRW